MSHDGKLGNALSNAGIRFSVSDNLAYCAVTSCLLSYSSVVFDEMPNRPNTLAGLGAGSCIGVDYSLRKCRLIATIRFAGFR